MRPAIATWALGIAALSMMMFPPPPAGARGRDGAGKGLTSRAKLGKRFVSELGCPVCHVIRDQKTTARKDAPDLRREGEKVRPAWLFDFLRNPRTLRPWLKARMSNFRLTEREALAVTLFLLTQRKAGKAAPGAVRRGPPSKARLAEGKKLFDLYECGKCHPAGGKTTDAEGESLAPDFRLAARRLRAEWIPLWLKDPQAFQPGTKMPNFFYDAGEAMEEEPDKKIRLLADYIMTIGPRPFSANFDRARRKYPDVDARAGAQLVRELNCAGCHRLSGVPAARKIAPVLSNAGSKFRRDWLVSFIRKPYTLRPAGYVLSWRSRMPGFRLTEKESSAIADYLMSLTTLDLAGNFRDEGRMSRRQRYRGRKMFKKIYGCVGCHRIKGRRGKIEGGLSGPDLSGAGDRLQPAFIYQFIRDPRAFEPEGKMPVFGHYLPEKDARFLTRYLLRMQ